MPAVTRAARCRSVPMTANAARAMPASAPTMENVSRAGALNAIQEAMRAVWKTQRGLFVAQPVRVSPARQTSIASDDRVQWTSVWEVDVESVIRPMTKAAQTSIQSVTPAASNVVAAAQIMNAVTACVFRETVYVPSVTPQITARAISTQARLSVTPETANAEHAGTIANVPLPVPSAACRASAENATSVTIENAMMPATIRSAVSMGPVAPARIEQNAFFAGQPGMSVSMVNAWNATLTTTRVATHPTRPSAVATHQAVRPVLTTPSARVKRYVRRMGNV